MYLPIYINIDHIIHFLKFFVITKMDGNFYISRDIHSTLLYSSTVGTYSMKINVSQNKINVSQINTVCSTSSM